MPRTYYEKKSLEDMPDYDLYYNYKKLDERLLIAESSRYVSFEIKEQMREFYDDYVAEIDRRVDEGLLTTMDLEDIEEKVDIQIEKEKRENGNH